MAPDLTNVARRGRWWLLAVLAASMLVLGLVQVGQATAPKTIVVTTSNDAVKTDGFCSLREAVIAANKDRASSSQSGECPAGNGADTIVIPAGTYTLTRTDNGNEDAASTGDLDITASVTISPTGPVTITAVSGFTDRIFHIFCSNVTILNITITNGNVSGDGGGIYVASGATLTLKNSILTNNTAAGRGGAIYNAGTLSLSTDTISGNKITKTTSTYGGGGLYNASGTATLVNVTIANNTANSASGSGGNIRQAGGTLSTKNTLIASAVSGGNCAGTIASQGFNLSTDNTCSSSFNKAGDLNNAAILIGPLQDNGGWTFTHALTTNSPAIDHGTNAGCPATDQRGFPRPIGPACDIGSYEVQDPAQTGPVFIVNSASDTDNGVCSTLECTLREAIKAANARPNGSSPDQIRFGLPGAGPFVVQLTSALPTITGAVIVDGATQPVTIDGANAAAGSDCFVINGSGSTLKNLTIRNCPAAGIRVLGGAGNTFTRNSITNNGALGIDLGTDGVTANDAGDADTGPNNLQNSPVLISAGSAIKGRLNSIPNAIHTLEFYANTACDLSGSGEGQTYLGTSTATTDASGDVYFTANVSAPAGQFIVATDTAPDGSTSEFSRCITVGADNTSWPAALKLDAVNSLPVSIDQVLDREGESRWYKFSVQPNSKITVKLTNLPANYDLTLYKDISETFQALNAASLNPINLNQLGAEFAPDAFTPDAFTPDAFTPDAFTPDAFTPDAFTPDAFTADIFSPDAFTPNAFTPDAFTPDAFTPDAFTPDAFTPDAFTPDAFTPDAFTPDAFTPDAFTSAQTRSVLGVSAFEGTAGEGLRVNSWNNSGEFYVRVRGRNGAFNLNSPFHLEVTVVTGECNNVQPIATPSSIAATAGNYRTIVLMDTQRMTGTAAEKNTLQARLATFIARPEVSGVVVDVSADSRVAAANVQADTYPACPYVKNLVADAIKDIVDRYHAQNPLQYVVIVGNDDVIPFFRYPDQATLGNEVNYAPPVLDNTASQASLKLSYVLSQDRYGSPINLSFKSDELPVPDLAVGRLVETAAEATHMLDAYLSIANGVVTTPTSSLVTGYDFLADAADAVSLTLRSGIGAAPDGLIAPRDLSPQSPEAWTSNDLRVKLLDSRHDVIFLAGHFSANSALAADYSTRLTSSEVAASAVDLTNALIFSAGCHAAYNIVDAHGVPNVTHEPDWAQTFARKGATLIAGTGYQYGDTDFIEYSERLYLDLSQQLLVGTGPVPIGKALVAAKQQYLADTPQLRPIHEKTFLEATLFGLPMLSVNLPNGRGTPASTGSIVSTTNPFTINPGATLGLRYADVTIAPTLNMNTKVLDVVSSTEKVTATYFSGAQGIVVNPVEPILPLEVRNVSVPGTLVARGVGFRGGAYTSSENVLPLNSAATTEIRGVHPPFVSNVFFPAQFWRLNYLSALVGRPSQLAIMPAQFRSSAPDSMTGTLRVYNNLNFRMYYSDNTTTYGSNTPALAAAPSIVKVVAQPDDQDNVKFQITAVGDPSAGIQEVWTTYTALNGPYAGQWRSLDLQRSTNDSTVWEGTLPLNGTAYTDIRFVVQAVNGVGLVSLVTDLGRDYIPGNPTAPNLPTSLTLSSPATSGPYGSQATFEAVLTSNGTPLANQNVYFALGPQRRLAKTDANGHASASITLLGFPGTDSARATFDGTSTYLPSSAEQSFQTNKQTTLLTLAPAPASGYPNANSIVVATLKDAAGRLLSEKTVFFVVTGPGGSYSTSEITDYAGRAVLSSVPLLHGDYTIQAYFSGVVPLNSNGTVTTLALNDDRYLSSTATVSLRVLNRVPIANPDTYLTDKNKTLTIAATGVLSNDLDADGDPLTASLITGPAHGTLTLNADGAFTYVPNNNYVGSDAFTYSASDAFGGSSSAIATITVRPANRPPKCDSAWGKPGNIWPPNGKFQQISIFGVSDPDANDTFTISITGIRQDEQTSSDGDGHILGSNLADVRAKRLGNGNGRVYHLYFAAHDNHDGECEGHIRIAVAHDQGGLDAMDGGPLYDSINP